MSSSFETTEPFVEILPVEDVERLGSRWEDLGKRAADPNPFAESAFIVPALRHIAPRGLVLLCVWSGRDRERLDGLAILRRPPAPFLIVNVWRSDQAALPALLIDRKTAPKAISAIAARLAACWPSAPALCIPWIYEEGLVAAAIREHAALRGVSLPASNPRQRAALNCSPATDFETSIDRKRGKEWRRLRRRLGERGSLEFAWSCTEDAIDDFLRLEAGGWKGSRGTALAADDNRAAFARAMLGDFARENRLRIARLTLDRRLIASGVLLQSGDRLFFWKIAYDEALSAFSPGVQLTLEMQGELAAAPNIGGVDSCADPGHPMIDRVWRQRLDLADMVLPLRSGAVALHLALSARRATAFARAELKRARKLASLSNGMIGRKLWPRAKPSANASPSLQRGKAPPGASPSLRRGSEMAATSTPLIRSAPQARGHNP